MKISTSLINIIDTRILKLIKVILTINCKVKCFSSNKGFKILSKLGWKEGEGLGVDGQGIRYPVNVHKKDNRRGLGCSPKQKTAVRS